MPRKTFKLRITTPELIAQINPKNKKLVERYLKNFDTRRSDASVRVYKSNFDIFFCWNTIENENKFFVDIKKIEFMDFFDYCVNTLQWSSARYANMWSSLSSLSNFVENYLDDDYPDFRNQIKKIEKLPNAPVRKKTILKEEQVNALLNHLIDEEEYGQACFIALACFSGARLSELFRFDLDLIDIDNTAYDGLFIETKEEIKTKGRGKQGKALYKYIIKEAFVPYLNLWLPQRKEIMDKNSVEEHGKLFVKLNGQPATPETIRGWTIKWGEYLSSEDITNPSHDVVHIYPHCFRHYIVTYLSRLGLEQEFIIEIMGWTSGEMYKIYNDMSAKEKNFKSLDKLKVELNKIEASEMCEVLE